MKLIIDIPEEEYERIKDIPNDYKLLIHKAVTNGTPFDSVIEDIKDEIKELRYSLEETTCYHDEAEALEIALEIIDNHISGKENE